MKENPVREREAFHWSAIFHKRQSLALFTLLFLKSGPGCQDIFQTLAKIQTTSVPASPSPLITAPLRAVFATNNQILLITRPLSSGPHTHHTCFKPAILSSSLSASSQFHWLSTCLAVHSVLKWSDLRLIYLMWNLSYNIMILRHCKNCECCPMKGGRSCETARPAVSASAGAPALVGSPSICAFVAKSVLSLYTRFWMYRFQPFMVMNGYFMIMMLVEGCQR